jgi:hypothetical protein
LHLFYFPELYITYQLGLLGGSVYFLASQRTDLNKKGQIDSGQSGIPDIENRQTVIQFLVFDGDHM